MISTEGELHGKLTKGKRNGCERLRRFVVHVILVAEAELAVRVEPPTLERFVR